ncbi:YebC/PmpR family DNA-binding transcriptional regulator [Candidatus Babeliales bacterium]|nr:YebC/PmpR family DNA-binding transcriptional regulator [Candidatus Babeliales bacterium]
MAGHSKWANIKHKKAKQDAQRGKVFTRLTKEITVAAREGGGDPDGNSKLRLLIDKAKYVNMPNENINRAIKKGTGELAGASYEFITYEGYGPGGMALIVTVLTDNKNRTVSALRHVFSKCSGNLAESGAVMWMFDQRGVLVVKANGKTEDDVLESLLDYNVYDVKKNEDIITVICLQEDLEVVKKALEEAGFVVDSADLSWIAKNPVKVSSENEDKAFKLLEAIDDLDDVQDTYANLE